MSKQFDPLRTTAPELQSRKGTIIIVGDSWACGEWQDGKITHQGLERYLLEDGYEVINYGKAGGSNSLSYLSLLEAMAQNHIDKSNTKVCFFWTDWHRDLYRQFDIIDLGGIVKSDVERILIPKTYDEETLHRVFYRLFEKLEIVGLPIGLIGGCSDTIQIGKAHSNLYTVCQSLTNLCLNDVDTLDDPTFSIFTQPEFFAKKFISSQNFINDMEKANSRRLAWTHNPDWFWPDGNHANRHAHRKLYDLLKQNKYL
jgi:hypothetical protein